MTNADHAIIFHYSGELHCAGRCLPSVSFTGPLPYSELLADASTSWSRQVAKHLEQACRSPIDGCCVTTEVRIVFRFVHAPGRSAYPLEAHSIPSHPRRSQMPCDESSRGNPANLDMPPFMQARLPHDPPASAIHAQTQPPAAPARSASLPGHLPCVASPSLASQSRVGASPLRYHHVCACCVLRVDAMRAHPSELALSGRAGYMDSP